MGGVQGCGAALHGGHRLCDYTMQQRDGTLHVMSHVAMLLHRILSVAGYTLWHTFTSKDWALSIKGTTNRRALIMHIM
jgi:hypothetical protein